MPSALERLAGPGKALAAEPYDAKEFAGLRRSGIARLKDAQNASNSLEGRFDLAYNAAHALCLAASLPCGITAFDHTTALSCFRCCRTR